MNRRSFLKRLGLLAAVPFVPVAAFGDLIQNPGSGYKCYKSNAQTLKELVSQIRIAQKHKLLQPRSDVFGVISLKPHNWEYILNEIYPGGQFTDVGLLDKGFDNFIMRGIPILKRG